MIGREGEERVTARTPPTGGAVLDPEQRARQLRQAARKVLQDDLRRELLRHLRDTSTPHPRQLLADDHGGVAHLALVDADPAAPRRERVAPPVAYVLVGKVHSAPPRRSLFGRDALPRATDDPVHDAVLDGLLRPHYVVAVGVALDLLEGLPRRLGQNLVHAPLGAHELPGLDLHVRRLSPRSPLGPRLM